MMERRVPNVILNYHVRKKLSLGRYVFNMVLTEHTQVINMPLLRFTSLLEYFSS